MEEEILRYPAAPDTDDFFYETEDECYQTDGTMSGNMEESEWFGALNPATVGKQSLMKRPKMVMGVMMRNGVDHPQ